MFWFKILLSSVELFIFFISCMFKETQIFIPFDAFQLPIAFKT